MGKNYNPHGTKLSQEKADKIRTMHKSGIYPVKSLAKRFGVTEDAIYKVLTGERWPSKNGE